MLQKKCFIIVINYSCSINNIVQTLLQDSWKCICLPWKVLKHFYSNNYLFLRYNFLSWLASFYNFKLSSARCQTLNVLQVQLGIRRLHLNETCLPINKYVAIYMSFFSAENTIHVLLLTWEFPYQKYNIESIKWWTCIAHVTICLRMHPILILTSRHTSTISVFS